MFEQSGGTDEGAENQQGPPERCHWGHLRQDTACVRVCVCVYLCVCWRASVWVNSDRKRDRKSIPWRINLQQTQPLFARECAHTHIPLVCFSSPVRPSLSPGKCHFSRLIQIQTWFSSSGLMPHLLCTSHNTDGAWPSQTFLLSLFNPTNCWSSERHPIFYALKLQHLHQFFFLAFFPILDWNLYSCCTWVRVSTFPMPWPL